MSTKPPKTQETKQELRQEIKELEAQIKQLKTEKPKSTAKFSSTLKSATSFVCIVLCAVMLNFSIAAFWVKRTVVNTEVWTDKTAQIIQNKDVQADISQQITDEIFSKVDVKTIIQDSVPPKATALAVPLTNSLKSYTTEQIQKILASSKFQEYWTKVNTSAHEGIVASLENKGKTPENNNYVIYINNNELLLNLKPIVQQIQTELSNKGLSFVSNINTNNINKTVTLTKIESLPEILVAFNVINKMARVILVIGLLAGAAAIALARNKRRAIIGLCVAVITLMVLNVQLILIAQYPIVKQLAQSLQSASSASAQAVVDILIKDLVLYDRALMLISVIVLVAAIMSGPNKFATYIRNKLASLTATKKDNKVIKNLGDNATTYISITAFCTAIFIVFASGGNLTLSVAALVIASVFSLWLLSLKTSLNSKS